MSSPLLAFGIGILLQHGPGRLVERGDLIGHLHLHPCVGGQLPGLIEREPHDGGRAAPPAGPR